MKSLIDRSRLSLKRRLGQPYSLRRRLMSSAGLFITAVLVLFSLEIAFFINRTERLAWRGYQRETARNAAQSITNLLARTDDALTLANSLSEGEPARWSRAMSRLFQQSPYILEIIHLNASGQVLSVVADSNQPWLADLPGLQESPWVNAALAGQHYASGLVAAPSGETCLVIALPDHQGEVLAASLDRAVLVSAIQDIHLRDPGLVYLLEGQGQVIAYTGEAVQPGNLNLQGRPEIAAALSTSQGEWYGEYTNFAGLPVVGAAVHIPNTDWLVLTELSQKDAFAASRLAWILLGGGMLAFSALATWLAARYLERVVFWPMEKLRDGAERIGRGDLSFRVQVDQKDEIGQVAQAFDWMAEQLDERQRQLLASAERLNAEVSERRRAQETQRVSEARYRAIVEDQTELICRFTPDGVLTFVNEAYCRYFSQPREALLGSSFMPLIPAEDQAIVQQQVATLSLQNPVVTYIHRVILPDGQVRWQEWTDRALFDEGDCLVEYASVGRDITPRKLAEEELARRADQMDALYATSLEINAHQELPRLLRAITQRAVDLVGTSMGGLYLMLPDKKSLELSVSLNIPGEYEGTVLALGEGLSGYVAQAGTPFSIGDYHTWHGRAGVYDQAPFGRVLGVPLKLGDQVIGVITLTDQERLGEFSPEDIRLASLFADQAVIAIEKTRLYQQLREELAERNRIAEDLRRLNLELEDRVRARTAELAASNTALQTAFKALQSSEGEMRALFAAMTDLVIVYDQQGVYRKVAPTNPALLYLPESEILGKTVHQVLPPTQADLLLEGIRRSVETQRPVDIDYSLPINGQEVWFAGKLSPAPDGHVVLVARDITERKRLEGQLQYDAFHDALTGLPNRALFLDRLGQAIERAHRRPQDASAVLFLDLDRFKVINDSLGHAAGDRLLTAFARRLEKLLRSSDTAARLGGDEFVILLEELKGSSDAIHVAQRIQQELSIPFQLGAHQATTTASIGIVLNTGGYTRPADVLRDADIAMFRAKALGKDRYEIFDTTLRKRAIARMELESELRGALERGEFHLLYQPICALDTGRVAGLEALLRWHSASRGRVEPVEFIPVAEETGLIIPIGEWVLAEACRQTRFWQLRFPQDPPLAININLSGRQFDHPRLIDQVRSSLETSGLDPACLRLELTESAFMDHIDRAAEVLSKLLKSGVQFQIDDFGAGYSSLAYLQRFPIHSVKIDRGFIQHMASGGNQPGTEIVKTIVTLAQGLGIESIAEGIENNEQLEQLIGLNCPYGQGFFLAVPLESEAVDELLKRGGSLTKDTFR